jgi:uncharacterized protein (DUF1778 family)
VADLTDKDAALIRARSVLRTCLRDTQKTINNESRARVIQLSISQICDALDQPDAAVDWLRAAIN